MDMDIQLASWEREGRKAAIDDGGHQHARDGESIGRSPRRLCFFPPSVYIKMEEE